MCKLGLHKQRGKHSTGLEFKTGDLKKATNALLTLNSLKPRSSPWPPSDFFNFFVLFSEWNHILSGDAGKSKHYYPEHTQLLNSLGDYCSSFFLYDQSHRLDISTMPLTTH